METFVIHWTITSSLTQSICLAPKRLSSEYKHFFFLGNIKFIAGVIARKESDIYDVYECMIISIG